MTMKKYLILGILAMIICVSFMVADATAKVSIRSPNAFNRMNGKSNNINIPRPMLTNQNNPTGCNTTGDMIERFNILKEKLGLPVDASIDDIKEELVGRRENGEPPLGMKHRIRRNRNPLRVKGCKNEN